MAGRRGRQASVVRGLAVAAAAAGALILSTSSGSGQHRSTPPPRPPAVSSSATTAPAPAPPGLVAGPAHPNIVFILTDDLSTDLVPYMPHVLAMERAGMSFSNYSVTDSLCCPSRSSIFTGEFPHDTGVFTNSSSDGGYGAFQAHGDENHTFATALHAEGYRTAMLGKYLNGYYPSRAGPAPGWSTWDATGSAYGEYNYFLNENGRIVHYGRQPQDFLVSVLGGLAHTFVAQATQARAPFLVEVATFAPHAPYVAAPQDQSSFAGLKAPRRPSFDRIPKNAPSWLAHRKRLSKKDIAAIDRDFRKRVQSVQSVDRLIGALEAQVKAAGQAGNTEFVFSSDNGLHMGDYTLNPGKLTAFDTDVRVPLVVTGPHVPRGVVSPAVVQNIDLAPTFEQLAGAQRQPLVDGHSLVPLLDGGHPPWRTIALVEHHGRDYPRNDPDYQVPAQGDPPTYAALRTARWTYVQYDDGEREFYDRVRDPYELDNVYGSLGAASRRRLTADVARMVACHRSTACWAAAQPAATGAS